MSKESANVTLAALISKAEGLDVKSREAWVASTAAMLDYFEKYPQDTFAYNLEQRALFATARLEWVLQNTMTELTDRFTASEFGILLNCFKDKILDPFQLQYLASHVGDDLGWESDDDSDLIAKLQEISPAQRACLADVLERTWRAVETGRNPLDFAAQINFKLSQ